MATPFHFAANVQEAAARRQFKKLRGQMKFEEARNGSPMSHPGSAVLADAAKADFILGDDERYRSKHD